MSRTVECPKCKSFATVVEGTKDFKYVIECKNCGKFEITGSEERTARLHYTKRMKALAKNPCSFTVPFQIRNKNAKMIKQDLLNGIKYYPIITKGLGSRFKTIGYLRVNKRNPEGRLTIDTESIKVDDIANVQWKEASERYELQKGVEWHCVEGAYRKFTLVRCIADNPNVGTVREEYFLKPRAAEDQPNTEEPSI
jgi:hypothetical protein